jgi:Phage integrase family
MKPLAWSTYYHAWSRFLRRAGVRHAGTHAIRHRAATEIANSGVPIKDGMAMTGHKTVDMFLRYVHPDEKRVRKSVERVSAQRRKLVNSSKLTVPKEQAVTHLATPEHATSPTAQGNYRPYRRGNGSNREAPQDSRSAASERDAT